jgi:glycosyltransferase involved in cell wall biosynthesis
MKIAIVHDDLVQWGGAERMLLGLSEAFPDAPIYTSIYDKANLLLANQLVGKNIITSFMQKIPFWRKLYKALLPIYPLAFEQFDFSEYDVVISQTTRFAKSIITKPETVHICYMHTPPRFLYQFTEEKLSLLLKPLLSYLRMFDQITAERPDLYLAGSKNAQTRIKNIYDKKSEVLYPFVDVEQFDFEDRFDGGYYLVISRLNKYKNVDVIVQACTELGVPLKVIGRGPELLNLKAIASKNIEFIQGVPDKILKNIIAGCKGLIVGAEEDFGLTPLEAQAFGKPVIALGKGGALETVMENKTGIFFAKPTVPYLKGAIKNFEQTTFDSHECRKNAERFSKKHFIQQLRSFVENSVKTH